jgi:CHASE3 domain sensor protein
MREQPPDEAQSLAEGVNRDFRRLIAATALLALLGVGVLGYVLGSLRPDEQRYRSGAKAVELADTGMLDQETGLRGYLLTRDRVFLQPYEQGSAAVTSGNASIERYLGADPAVAPLILDMRVAQQAWISQWAVVVAEGRAPADSGASLKSFVAQGKSLFDAYRAKEALLNNRVQSRRDAVFTREEIALVAGLGAVLALELGLAAAMYRQRQTLRRVVVRPVASIVAATEAIATGDLTSELVPEGPSEFRRIGRSILTLRDALEEGRSRDADYREKIEAQSAQLRSILAMSREISGSLNLRYVLRTVGKAATGVSGFPRAIIWLAEDESGKTLCARFDTAAPDGALLDEATAEVGVGVVGQAVRYGRIATETEGEEPAVEVHPERALRAVAVPLIVGARVKGAVELTSPTPLRLTEEASNLSKLSLARRPRRSKRPDCTVKPRNWPRPTGSRASPTAAVLTRSWPPSVSGRPATCGHLP